MGFHILQVTCMWISLHLKENNQFSHSGIFKPGDPILLGFYSCNIDFFCTHFFGIIVSCSKLVCTASTIMQDGRVTFLTGSEVATKNMSFLVRTL